jgi:hypothetical protein
MGADEQVNDFVTDLWAVVMRLEDLPDLWHECPVLMALRRGHAKQEVRDLLINEQPKTVPDAEHICEEFDARQQANAVNTKFVTAMASSEPSVSVDNVNSRGGYRSAKHRGRGGGSRGGNYSGQGQSQQPRGDNASALSCFFAQHCHAPPQAMHAQGPPSSTPGGSAGPSRQGLNHCLGGPRPVHSVPTPKYVDYMATQEQH